MDTPPLVGKTVLITGAALRPSADHFPYSISKAALAALTQSLTVALAPRISVNGLALWAVLPPTDGRASPDVIQSVPLGRWISIPQKRRPPAISMACH